MGNQTASASAPDGEKSFATTLEGVTAQSGGDSGNAAAGGQHNGTQTAKSVAPPEAPTINGVLPLDAASASLSPTGATGLQALPVNSDSSDLPDVADIIATIARGSGQGLGTESSVNPSSTNPVAGAFPAVAAVGSSAATPTPTAADRADVSQDTEATLGAPTPATNAGPFSPWPAGLGADATIPLGPSVEGDSGLHIQGATIATPQLGVPGAPGQQAWAPPQPNAPTNAAAHSNAAPQIATGLAVDLKALATATADGDTQAGLQRDSKPALPTVTLPTSLDAKPSESTAGQTFNATLAATSTHGSPQSAREAAATAAQQPARPAQAAPAAAQIAVHIVRAMADGVSRFSVQLQPAELGRVEVKMEIGRDGTVRAIVTADRQETVDQLSRDSRALERALQDAGLKADSQNLHFSLRGGQNGRDLSENRTSSNHSGNGNADTSEVSDPAMLSHWSSVSGSTGALDIRV